MTGIIFICLCMYFNIFKYVDIRMYYAKCIVSLHI